MYIYIYVLLLRIFYFAPHKSQLKDEIWLNEKQKERAAEEEMWANEKKMFFPLPLSRCYWAILDWRRVNGLAKLRQIQQPIWTAARAATSVMQIAPGQPVDYD